MKKITIILCMLLVMLTSCGTLEPYEPEPDEDISYIETEETVFENNDDAQEYLEQQMLDGEEEITIYTTDDVDESFVMAAKGYDSEMDHLVDVPLFSRADYINEMYNKALLISSAEETNGVIKWEIAASYKISPEEEQAIEDTVQEMASSVEGSDVEKINTIVKIVDDKLTYEAEQTNELYSAIETNVGCCQHYAQLVYLLCKETGINARVVRGTFPEGGHEWNIVEIDGKWYHVDPTFEDTSPGEWVLVGDDKIKESRTLRERFEIFEEMYDISDTDFN